MVTFKVDPNVRIIVAHCTWMSSVNNRSDMSLCINLVILFLLCQQLCHFTRLKNEGMAKLTPDTSSVLVHKFNPSSNEAQRTTVEAMIYTPGKTGMYADFICPSSLT